MNRHDSIAVLASIYSFNKISTDRIIYPDGMSLICRKEW
jgi:hypothetical protein